MPEQNTEQTLQQRIQGDRMQALRARDKRRSVALSLILAAFKQQEVDTRELLDHQKALAILDKMLKERRQSVSQYEAAGRQDLVLQENFEIALITAYLPTPLSEAALNELIKAAVKSTNAASIKDMGQVVAILKPQVQGRADMALVSKKVKDTLN